MNTSRPKKKISKKVLKIAVFDDSDINRKKTVKILTDYGYEVIGESGNATEALTIAIQFQPQLCFVDLIFPDTTGYELMQKLNSKAMVPYFVTMSPLNLESISLESLSSGAIDFLAKPITENSLIKVVAKIESDYQNI